jgi:ubiquinone/menaquinone biosynthesis C-methylase UbiE
MTLPSYAMRQASFPEVYERCLVEPLFRPWAEITLQEVALSPGDRVLDIACGTGIVARIAKERLGDTGRVVGVDVSSDMLAVACAVAPRIDWREGDAAALPLSEGEQFDIVVCQQGLQFFTDKPAALREMRHALAKGGKLAVSTWRSDSEIPFARDLREIAERHLGAVADQRYSLGDSSVLEALLRDAGFHDVRVRTVSRTIRFESDVPFERLNAMALVGMSAAGRTMSPEERMRAVDTIAGESAPAVQRYATESGIAFEFSTNLATANS